MNRKMNLFTKDLIGNPVFPFRIDVFDFSQNGYHLIKQVATAFDRLVKSNGGYITYHIYKNHSIFLKRYSGFPITLESILDMFVDQKIVPIENCYTIEFWLGNRAFYAKFDASSEKFYKHPYNDKADSYIRVEM